MLISDPGIKERKVLRCGCNHRQQCRTCERRLDDEIILELAS
jgi:DNA sulfur modification protein DndD